MNLKDMRKRVDDWVQQYKIGYFNPHEILARLMEETGELAREINHRWGPKKKKPTEETKELEDEVADIIFTLICLSNSLNLNVEDSFDRMMDKLCNRDKDRFEKK